MQAAILDSVGEPSLVVRVREIEAPRAASGEVLVQVAARPIQPADFMFIQGRYRIRPVLPQVAGIEGTGTVIAVGENTRTAVGARVSFRCPGAWAEYVAVPEDRLYGVLDAIQDDAAAQFALNPITAWALLAQLEVGPGEWIAVNAAGSSIAQLVHGLARRRGVRVVGVVRSRRTDTLAFPALIDGDEPLASGILRLTGGEPVSGLLDSIGGRSIVDALPALGAGATIVSYAVLGQEPAVLSNADMIYRNLRWIGFGIDRWLSTNGVRRESMLRDLWDAIQLGAIALPVRSRHPLHNLHDALDEAETTRTHGKVLIVS